MFKSIRRARFRICSVVLDAGGFLFPVAGGAFDHAVKGHYAGMHWITTTRAQKPKKSRIRGPLMKTLFVAAPDAWAVPVTRLRAAALHTAVRVCFAFMVISFLYNICNISDG